MVPGFESRMDLRTQLFAVKSLKLGQRDSTDLLAISLSATDYVGHYYGTEGAEMCVQQVALDATIGRLLEKLDQILPRDPRSAVHALARHERPDDERGANRRARGSGLDHRRLD